MSGTEIFIVILFVVSAIWGFRRGIVVQMGSLLAFAIALAMCRLFGDAATGMVATMFGGKEAVENPAQALLSDFMVSCIGHVGLFIVVWAGVWLLSRTVRFVAKALHLGLLDSVAGGLFMAFKAAVVVSFVLNFAQFAAPDSSLAQCDGGVKGAVVKLAPAMLGYIQPFTCK